MGISGVSTDGRSELIRKKAFELYVKRGKTPGREMEDWLAAEKIVDRELQGAKIPTRNEPSSRTSVTSIEDAPSKLGFKRASG